MRVSFPPRVRAAASDSALCLSVSTNRALPRVLGSSSPLGCWRSPPLRVYVASALSKLTVHMQPRGGAVWHAQQGGEGCMWRGSSMHPCEPVAKILAPLSRAVWRGDSPEFLGPQRGQELRGPFISLSPGPADESMCLVSAWPPQWATCNHGPSGGLLSPA